MKIDISIQIVEDVEDNDKLEQKIIVIVVK
jgi:hypothetical protein